MKPKKVATSILIAALFIAPALFSVAPFVAAYGGGAANWQLTVAETAVSPGQGGGFGIWGWCELSGSSTPSTPTSGNAGDCQATIYFHPVYPGGPNVGCHFSFDVTSWAAVPLGSSGQGQYFGITNDLVIQSGTTSYVHSPGCAIVQSTGGITAAGTDLGPAQSGHYNLNFLLFGSTGEYQEQVSQTTH